MRKKKLNATNVCKTSHGCIHPGPSRLLFYLRLFNGVLEEMRGEFPRPIDEKKDDEADLFTQARCMYMYKKESNGTVHYGAFSLQRSSTTQHLHNLTICPLLKTRNNLKEDIDLKRCSW